MNMPMQDIYFVVGMINTAYSQLSLSYKMAAQNTLNYLRSIYLSEFFAMIGDIIQDTIWSIQTRENTCVLATESVLFKDNQGKVLWDNLTLSQQESFKQKILAFFASPNAQPVDSIAQVVGAIASIELPKNQQKDILNSLISNCYNQVHPRTSYHMLTLILKSSSPYLHEYQDHFVKLTEAQLKLKNEISVMNLEMWKEFAEDFSKKFILKQRVYEKSIKSNFLQSIGDQLLSCMIDCLFLDENTTTQSKDIKMSAFDTIESIVQVCDETVIQKIMDVFHNTFSSASLNAKENGILLFATIGLFPDEKLLYKLLEKNFQSLMEILNDENDTVVKKSLEGLSLMANSSPYVFLAQQNIELLIGKLLDFVKNIPHLRHISLEILNRLSAGLRGTEVENASKIFQDCVEYYKENIGSIFMSETSLASELTSIVQFYCMQTCSTEELTQMIHFSIVSSRYFIQKGNQYETLVEQFESIMSTAALRMEKESTNQTMSQIVNYIDLRIEKNLNLESTLSLIGSSAHGFMSKFEHHATSYKKIIQEALQSGNSKTSKVALSCLGDFMRNNYEFYCKNTEISTILFKEFKKIENWQKKIDIFTILTDLAIRNNNINVYKKNFIDLFDQIFTFVEDLIKEKKKFKHFEQLTKIVVECYQGFLMASNQKKIQADVLGQFERVINFVILTCSENQNPTVNYMKECLYLVYDGMGLYEQKLKSNGFLYKILNNVEINKMTQSLYEFKDRFDVKELLDYMNIKKKHFF